MRQCFIGRGWLFAPVNARQRRDVLPSSKDY
jgi:hypothetical protein